MKPAPRQGPGLDDGLAGVCRQIADPQYDPRNPDIRASSRAIPFVVTGASADDDVESRRRRRPSYTGDRDGEDRECENERRGSGASAHKDCSLKK